MQETSSSSREYPAAVFTAEALDAIRIGLPPGIDGQMARVEAALRAAGVLV